MDCSDFWYNPLMIKGITFDIDTTLTFEVSWYLITRKLGADPQQHSAIFSDFLENKISYADAKFRLIRLWQNTGNANKVFFSTIFNEIPLKNEAEKIISYFKSKGIIICLITGSVDLYAEMIANRLGVNYFYANTKLIWDKNEEIQDFKYDKNQGEKKVQQFKDFCIKLHLSKKDIFVVGDDENDIELFQYTKHGVAVKSPTSHKIEKFAWKTVTSLSELKDLV